MITLQLHEECLDVRDCQRFGQEAWLTREVDVRGDVTVDETVAGREAIEAADARCAPPQGRRREPEVTR